MFLKVQFLPKQRTCYLSFTKRQTVVLFRETIAAYCENNMIPINAFCERSFFLC
jgi:hypothetical protein